MNKLHYSPEAVRDLDEIWEYIYTDLASPVAAQSTIDRILTNIDRLKAHPNLGAPLSSVINTESSYRFLVSGNYLAFYRTVSQDIFIDRILYGGRDYMKLLFHESPDTPYSTRKTES